MLDTLTNTEKELVLKTVQNYGRARLRAGEDIEEAHPLTKPPWDYNNSGHYQLLQRYWEWVSFGLENGIPKAVNWGALYEVKEGPHKTLTEFWDQFWEAIRKYTTLDPPDDYGIKQLISLLLGQSSNAIRQKL